MSSVQLAESAEALGIGRLSAAGYLLKQWQPLCARIGGRLSYALADQVVYSFGNMVVAAIISRHCVQRQFGIYILTQRTMDILIQISNVLLWAPFTFYLPGTAENRERGYQGSIFGLQVFLCLVFSFAIWLASRWTSSPGHIDLHSTFVPLVVASSGILFREFTRRMYFAHMRFQEAFWTDLATVALQIIATLWLWHIRKLDVTHVLAGLCAGAVIVSLWWFAREGRALEVNLLRFREDFRKNMQLGRWFLGSNMVSLASTQCNPWVLSSVLGGASVGAYAVCESVVNIPRVAFTSMQNVMGPVLARAEIEDGKAGVQAVVRRMDRALFLTSVGAGLGVVAFGPAISRLIFRTPVASARTILLILALNLVAYTSTLAQSYGLTALGRVDKTFIANMMGVLAQAGVCLFLIRHFQVSGAAAAMLAGSCVVLVTRQLYFNRAVRTA